MKLPKLIVCPHCRAQIEEQNDKIICTSCDTAFEVNNGLLKFLTGDSDHGEFDHTVMQEVLAYAEVHGWRQARDQFMKPKNDLIGLLLDDKGRELSLQPLEGTSGSVLDFGCGYGGVSLALARRFDQVVSLDGSAQRVSFLNIIRQQEGLENIQPVCHIEPLKLPFADNSFDAIVIIGVFEYLPLNLPEMSTREAHHACLQSFHRVLKPGGKLLMHSKNRFGWNFLMGAADHNHLRFGPALPIPLADMLTRLKGKGRYRVINYSNRMYKKIMRDSGFTIEGMYWPYPGYQEPKFLVNLDEPISPQITEKGKAILSQSKSFAFSALAHAGLMPHLAPNLAVLATKD